MQRSTLLLPAALLIVVLSGVVGGPTSPAETTLVQQLVLSRETRPPVTQAMVWLTQLGGAWVLIPLALATAAFLWWRSQAGSATWLLVTVIGGRMVVELLKWVTDRPRPTFEEHPVSVASQAFPSGHAANSMITYLAIALFVLPARWRSAGTAAAVSLSLAIGITRPILGVHWPSDVMGGWVFGAAWTWLLWRFSAARLVRA